MPELIDRGRLRLGSGFASWAGLAAVYAAAQGLSAWSGQRARGARDQYQDFRQPSFAPPGPVFPVVWSALNLATATSAWRLWRGRRAPGPEVPHAQVAVAWWALGLVLRSGYGPVEFGARRYWAATVARRADPAAAALAAPEIAWTAFATVLSTVIAVQNA